MAPRNERLGEEIKRDLMEIIRNEINDPRIDAFMSITDVCVTSDLSLSRIFVSKIGTDAQRRELIDALEKASGFFRTQLSKRLKIRSVPELRFFLDDSMIYGAKIDEILNSLDESN